LDKDLDILNQIDTVYKMKASLGVLLSDKNQLLPQIQKRYFLSKTVSSDSSDDPKRHDKNFQPASNSPVVHAKSDSSSDSNKSHSFSDPDKSHSFSINDQNLPYVPDKSNQDPQNLPYVPDKSNQDPQNSPVVHAPSDSSSDPDKSYSSSDSDKSHSFSINDQNLPYVPDKSNQDPQNAKRHVKNSQPASNSPVVHAKSDSSSDPDKSYSSSDSDRPSAVCNVHAGDLYKKFLEEDQMLLMTNQFQH
jgi:hypothetical protein